jgi:putative lipoprotein
MAGQNSFTLDNPDDYTLTFNADETVRIQADCNRARGTYALENGTLAIMLGSMMLAECGPNSRYVTFLNRLEETATYVVEGEQLFLNLVADSGNLVFDAIEATQVTGTVTYRPRIALPPDAVITVQLQDISLADADAEVIGEQVIQAEGRQAPFAYAISYEPEDIRPNNRYSVAARIEDGDGDLLFTSDTIIPVITDDNPTSNVEIVVQQASP